MPPIQVCKYINETNITFYELLLLFLWMATHTAPYLYYADTFPCNVVNRVAEERQKVDQNFTAERA